MTDRTTALMFALQGLTLTGLLALGVFVYQSGPSESEYGAGEIAGTAAVPGRTAPERGTAAPGGAATPSKPDAASAETERLDRLGEQVADLARAVAALKGEVAGHSGTKAPAASASEPGGIASADWEQLRAKADLASRHLQETKTSDWGDTATSSINSAYAEEAASGYFFSKYKGDLVTDCRGSVCSLNWTPDSQAGTPTSAESGGDLFEEAQSELIALAANAPNAGQIKVSIDRSTNPPSIRVLVDNSGGDSDHPPDAVSRYLDSGKRGQ